MPKSEKASYNCKKSCSNDNVAVELKTVLAASFQLCNAQGSSPENSCKKVEETIEVPFGCWYHVSAQINDNHRAEWEACLTASKTPRIDAQASVAKWEKLDPSVQECLAAFFNATLNALEKDHTAAINYVITSHSSQAAGEQRERPPMDLVSMFAERIETARKFLFNDNIVRPSVELAGQPPKFHSLFKTEWTPNLRTSLVTALAQRAPVSFQGGPIISGQAANPEDYRWPTPDAFRPS
jgi:hypothetical protein